MQNQSVSSPPPSLFRMVITARISSGAISVLRQQGLEIFFSTFEMDRAGPSTGPISRLVIHPDDDLQSFRRKLYGSYDSVGKLRRLVTRISASFRREVGASSQA